MKAHSIESSSHPAPPSGRRPPASCFSGDYRVVMVSRLADLAPCAEPWDRLAAEAPARVHTISHAWIASFFEHLVDPGADCRCLLVFRGGDLVGVLPFVVTRKYFSALTKTDVCAPTSEQTFASDLVCRGEDSASIIDAMIEALDCFLPGAWELTFHHVSRRSQVVDRFAGNGRPALCHSQFDGYGNFIRTDGSFEEYARSLKPHFAANLRRVSRKSERLPGFRLDVLTGAQAQTRRLEDFLLLEASGWKGRGGTAIKHNAREIEFYRAFTGRLQERGWLEWHVLSAGGHAIAAHMAIRCGRVLYLWKIAYDERYSAYAPGNVLMLRAVERAFESPDIDELNCLTDSPWNRDWNMERREYFKVTVWPKRLVPFVAGYCRSRLKDALKRIPGARSVHRGIRRAAGPFS